MRFWRMPRRGEQSVLFRGKPALPGVREDGDEVTGSLRAEPQRDWIRFVQPKGASRRTGVAMGLYAAERGSRVIRAMWTRALSVAMIPPLVFAGAVGAAAPRAPTPTTALRAAVVTPVAVVTVR